MRDAFFTAEPAITLSAEMMLTPREAFAGVTVPLRRPAAPDLSRAAAAAARSGTSGARPAPALGEVAAAHAVHVRVPAGVSDGATFRFSLTPPGAPSTVVEVRISIR